MRYPKQPSPQLTPTLTNARIMRIHSLFAAVLLAVCGGGGSAQAPAPASTPSTGGGATPAAPTPPAPPTATRAQVVDVATGLADPWALAFLPDGRMLVTEKAGTLRIVSPSGVVGNPISGVPAVDAAGQGGLLDVLLDPNFASNQRIYFTFSESGTGGNGTAVARADLNLAGLSLGNVKVIYQQLPKVSGTSGHYGSRLVFDKQGHLFVTLGDRQSGSQRGYAQDVTRGNGKVVRITAANGDAAPGNPSFAAGSVKGLWSYGHRNPQGAALHPSTGELWTNEHGPRGGDEVNRTLAGKNYGWPIISYGHEYGTTTQVGEGTAKAGMEQPASYWETIDGSPYTSGGKASIAPSGMMFYTGDKFPEWRGNLFIGALAGTAVWRLVLSADNTSITGRERLSAPSADRIRDVRQGPDGNIYLLSTSGKIMRMQPQ